MSGFLKVADQTLIQRIIGFIGPHYLEAVNQIVPLITRFSGLTSVSLQGTHFYVLVTML